MTERTHNDDPLYFLDSADATLMLHHPSDRKVEIFREVFGARAIPAEKYRKIEDDRMGRDGSVPTGGYEELEVE